MIIQAEAKPCPECGGPRAFVEVGEFVRLRTPTATRLGKLGAVEGAVSALVCAHCGHITLYAKYPLSFLDKEK